MAPARDVYDGDGQENAPARRRLEGGRWVKADVLVLPDSKNGRPRRLPIAGEIAEILARREAART